jgi:hypothetical protein
MFTKKTHLQDKFDSVPTECFGFAYRQTQEKMAG